MSRRDLGIDWRPIGALDRPDWPRVDQHACLDSVLDLIRHMRTRFPGMTEQEKADELDLLDEYAAVEHHRIDHPAAVDWADVAERQAQQFARVDARIEAGTLRPEQRSVMLGRGVDLRPSLPLPDPAHPKYHPKRKSSSCQQ